MIGWSVGEDEINSRDEIVAEGERQPHPLCDPWIIATIDIMQIHRPATRRWNWSRSAARSELQPAFAL